MRNLFFPSLAVVLITTNIAVAKKIKFEIDQYKDPVILKVSDMPKSVAIDYSKRPEGKVELKFKSSLPRGDFDFKSCNALKDIYSSEEKAGQLNGLADKFIIPKEDGFSFSIPLMPIASHLEDEIRVALVDNGFDPENYSVIENLSIIGSPKVSFSWGEDSMSSIAGQDVVSSFMNSRLDISSFGKTGMISFSLARYDFLCDFLAGKVKLKVSFETSTGYYPKTKVFSEKKIHKLSGELHSKNQVINSQTKSPEGKKLIAAALFGESAKLYLGKSISELTPDAFMTLFNGLYDLSGREYIEPNWNKSTYISESILDYSYEVQKEKVDIVVSM